MKQLKGIAILWILLSLSGCLISYHLVEFEVLEPAEITFPGQVRQLLVLDRLPLTYNLSDSISLSFLGWGDYDGFDTLVSYNIYKGLYERLMLSPVETHNWPIWDSKRQSDLLAKYRVRLTKREVADLCRENPADAILCLESCNLKLRLHDTTFVRIIDYDPYCRGVLTSFWVIYLPDYPKPFHEFTIEDSIDYGLRGRNLNMYKFVREISYLNGQKFGEKITPFWQPTSRKIFSGPHPVLTKASVETQHGNWDSSFALWSRLASSGSRSNRAKAMYNLSVYYELEDNLDSAAWLLDRAVLLYDNDLIHSYQREIYQRLEKRKSILKQVEGASLDLLP